MSDVPRELELKLRAPDDCWDRLRSNPAFSDKLKSPASDQMLVSVYFDSDDLYLRNHGMNLRVRRVGDRHLQTLKIAPPEAPYFERTELESELADGHPNLAWATEHPDLPPIAPELQDEIKPVFETHVERKAFRIADTDSEIELAFDRGQIVANGSVAPILELELELKRGRPADLFELARSISAIVPVELAIETKSERGYALLDAAGPKRKAKAKAEPISLSPPSSVAEGFKAIAHSCLRQILANSAGVRLRDPDAVHQMRVGMRRLRAAMSLFSDVVRDEQSEQIRTKLRQYAGELAPARDLEVMIVDVLRPFSRRYANEKGFASLIRSFVRRRTQAYDRAVQAVTSDDFRRFTIECAAWIEAGDWVARHESNSAAAPAWPIRIYAAHRIARQRKKLLRGGRRLAELEPSQVHQLRIRAKKLRYTVEFFESLYLDTKKSKRWKRFVAEMQLLQDALGMYNDMAVRRKIFLEFTAGLQAKKNPTVAFAAGQIVGEQHAIGNQHLKRAAKALARLEDVKPFWKVEQPPEDQKRAPAASSEPEPVIESSEQTAQTDAA